MVARFYGRKGAPIGPLLSPETPPYVADDGAVTLWRRLVHRPALSSYEFGRLLRVVHECGDPATGTGDALPELAPLDTVAYWLGRVPA